MGARVERRGDRVGRDVEVVRVGVVERRADVLPVVGERGADLLLGGDQHGRAGREVQERAEALDGQELRDVGALAGAAVAAVSRRSSAAISASSRCSAASSAAGAISTSVVSPSERWVNVENQRSDSISMSKRSTRTARSSVAG